jgi:hypothetical protein
LCFVANTTVVLPNPANRFEIRNHDWKKINCYTD